MSKSGIQVPPLDLAPRPVAILDELAVAAVLLPNRDEVGRYITVFAELGELLVGICRQTRDFFGPAVELSLEVYKDPEIEDRYLTLYVRPRRGDASITDRIEMFRRQFDDPLQNISGYLLITKDHRRPRGVNAV